MDANEPLEAALDHSDNNDWQLEYVIDFAHLGYCPGITLTTAAGLITGTLIGGEEYHDLFAALYNQGMSEESKEAFQETVEDWKEPYRSFREKRQPLKRTFFIHLKDAKLFAPGAIIPKDGMLWRGRIDQVIGFTIGKLVQ